MLLLRLVIIATALVAFSSGRGEAANERESAQRNTDCVDACIKTQRSCVVDARSIADKSKCTDDNAACSTKCPLPSGGPQHK